MRLFLYQSQCSYSRSMTLALQLRVGIKFSMVDNIIITCAMDNRHSDTATRACSASFLRERASSVIYLHCLSILFGFWFGFSF